ncbi:MAG: chorismate synthase [Bacteroidia bacterium]|jgi:chorismate synthase|nr:chorismate synthase [Bacteroidia bacterium]MCC6768444.1 chorismate synthase [Bacteroidia bacterium]
MAGSTFGNLFRLHTFGESHGPAIGGIVDGCPPSLVLDLDAIQHQLDRRKPGQSRITTGRKESDTVQFLSGLLGNVTTGTPIGFQLQNEDQRSGDYRELEQNYRPSHADYTFDQKFGIRDHRGGGRSSARETACRVVAGSIAMQYLKTQGIEIFAYVSAVGPIQMPLAYNQVQPALIDSNLVRCPHSESAAEMEAYILRLKKEGDTTGGVITGVIKGVPPGLGEPVFDKLHADLGKAMLSINAVKGFEYGSGFAGCAMKGTEHNDIFSGEGGRIHTLSNRSGGIQGGISNGEDIYFNVAFKPVATVLKPQQTVNKDGENVALAVKGRHDSCVVPRAVPIVEAMAALVIADHLLKQRTINNTL